MLAGASGFLGSSVFSWVRSAIYNRKLYNNIVLPTKNSVSERAGEGSARKALEPMWDKPMQRNLKL